MPWAQSEVLHEHALAVASEQLYVVLRHPKHRGSNPLNHHAEKAVAGEVTPCQMPLETTPLGIVALVVVVLAVFLSLVDDASRVVVAVFCTVERRKLAQTIVPSSNVAAPENADYSDWISLARDDNGAGAEDSDCGSQYA